MSRYFGVDDRDAITWEPGTPRAEANGGWGGCYTGSRPGVICVFNGIGCPVDHVQMAMRHLPIEGWDAARAR
jgi:hypothetical protein